MKDDDVEDRVQSFLLADRISMSQALKYERGEIWNKCTQYNSQEHE